MLTANYQILFLTCHHPFRLTFYKMISVNPIDACAYCCCRALVYDGMAFVKSVWLGRVSAFLLAIHNICKNLFHVDNVSTWNLGRKTDRMRDIIHILFGCISVYLLLWTDIITGLIEINGKISRFTTMSVQMAFVLESRPPPHVLWMDFLPDT